VKNKDKTFEDIMLDHLSKYQILCEIMRLSKEIKRHNNLYYQECMPEISDYEYDMMLKKLEKLEEENPEFLYPDSPTQIVGH